MEGEGRTRGARQAGPGAARRSLGAAMGGAELWPVSPSPELSGAAGLAPGPSRTPDPASPLSLPLPSRLSGPRGCRGHVLALVPQGQVEGPWAPSCKSLGCSAVLMLPAVRGGGGGERGAWGARGHPSLLSACCPVRPQPVPSVCRHLFPPPCVFPPPGGVPAGSPPPPNPLLWRCPEPGPSTPSQLPSWGGSARRDWSLRPLSSLPAGGLPQATLQDPHVSGQGPIFGDGTRSSGALWAPACAAAFSNLQACADGSVRPQRDANPVVRGFNHRRQLGPRTERTGRRAFYGSCF